jgi:hypothetical protein
VDKTLVKIAAALWGVGQNVEPPPSGQLSYENAIKLIQCRWTKDFQGTRIFLTKDSLHKYYSEMLAAGITHRLPYRRGICHL